MKRRSFLGSLVAAPLALKAAPDVQAETHDGKPLDVGNLPTEPWICACRFPDSNAHYQSGVFNVEKAVTCRHCGGYWMPWDLSQTL